VHARALHIINEKRGERALISVSRWQLFWIVNCIFAAMFPNKPGFFNTPTPAIEPQMRGVTWIVGTALILFSLLCLFL
jgi:hypothetical protein